MLPERIGYVERAARRPLDIARTCARSDNADRLPRARSAVERSPEFHCSGRDLRSRGKADVLANEVALLGIEPFGEYGFQRVRSVVRKRPVRHDALMSGAPRRLKLTCVFEHRPIPVGSSDEELIRRVDDTWWDTPARRTCSRDRRTRTVRGDGSQADVQVGSVARRGRSTWGRPCCLRGGGSRGSPGLSLR
jgi:hypothetical protein